MVLWWRSHGNLRERRKLASLGESTQVRVLQTFTTVVTHLTKTIKASASRAQDEGAADGLRNAFKAAVYFLATTIATICRLRTQADQALVKQKSGVSGRTTVFVLGYISNGNCVVR
jgi:hypothetical protein